MPKNKMEDRSPGRGLKQGDQTVEAYGTVTPPQDDEPVAEKPRKKRRRLKKKAGDE